MKMNILSLFISFRLPSQITRLYWIIEFMLIVFFFISVLTDKPVMFLYFCYIRTWTRKLKIDDNCRLWKSNNTSALYILSLKVLSDVDRRPLSLAATCESYLSYSAAPSVRALGCNRVHAVYHRRVTNKHYDAFAIAVSINQTAPVAVPLGHYGAVRARCAIRYAISFTIARCIDVACRVTVSADSDETFFRGAALPARAREGWVSARPSGRVVDKLGALSRCARRFGLMLSPRPRDLFVAAWTTCRRLATDVAPRHQLARCLTTPTEKYFKSCWCNINEAFA